MKAGHRWVIPGAELRPLILEWARQNEYEQRPCYEASRGGANGQAPRVTLYQALQQRSGVPRRRISGILNDTNESPNLSFDTADKLLCAMVMVHEWHDRLASYYEEPIEVSAAEARRLNEKERAMRDLRDPQDLGSELLGLVAEERKEYPGATVQPSTVADRYQHALEACPDWTGDGFMSSNPADHHSKVSQADNERIKARA